MLNSPLIGSAPSQAISRRIKLNPQLLRYAASYSEKDELALNTSYVGGSKGNCL